MTTVLKRLSLLFGIGLLILSIYWSQDGFNFTVAGDAGYSQGAVMVGYFVAAGATLLQFVFSTNLKGLNLTLVVFGLIAYVYSIGTNHEGIVHMQGTTPNQMAAWILAVAIDGVPEPLIAWSLGEALSGDFLGNIFGAFGSFLSGKPLGAGQRQEQPRSDKPQHGNNGHQSQGQKPKDKQKGFERRAELSKMYHGPNRRQEGQGGQPKKIPMPMLRDLNDEDENE